MSKTQDCQFCGPNKLTVVHLVGGGYGVRIVDKRGVAATYGHEDCTPFEMSFEIERLTNRAIRSKVEYSAENVQDCERLLRTWKPRLIARKKLLRAALRLSRAVLAWIKEQEQSFDRTMAIMDVENHINRLRLLLGKKVLVARTIDPDTNERYCIYSRLHHRKVIGVAIKAKFVK